MDTVDEVVAAGVEAQAKIDKYLAKAYDAARDLTAVTERGVELGMVRGIDAKIIIGDVRSLQGRIGEIAANFGLLHQRQTDACKEAGVDLGNVTTAGGVVIGGADEKSGGR